MGQGYAVPVLGVHSRLGMGEGSELMTQGIHRVVSVVTHSHPADAGPCARRGSTPFPAPLQGLKIPMAVWSLWNGKSPKRFILTTVS